MREMLFRGKRADNGAWIKGYLLGDEITGEYFIHASGNSVNESPKVGEEGVLHFLAFEVIPETVGQYTGLKGEHGTQIFEGDIIEGYFDHKKIRGYIFYGSNAKFFVQRKGLYGIELNNAEDWIEVIGNIHDNPELLEDVE